MRNARARKLRPHSVASILAITWTAARSSSLEALQSNSQQLHAAMQGSHFVKQVRHGRRDPCSTHAMA
eukprot:6479035-Amphidinium_carterae.1